MIEIKEKSKCCGCTACKSICPKNAIQMLEDEEGFLYPNIDVEKCVNCGLCEKVCPVLNKIKNKKFEQKGYIFQNSNNNIRKESTSGGAFSAIAENILDKNGVVYGVGFDDDFKVVHKRVDKKEELRFFRNSKYVQSDPNITFSQVLEDLKHGILVCYSGTACQIEGLKNFLQKDYENLVTIDVVCRSVPSPLLWKKYYEYRSKNKKIKKVYFREKLYGYKYSNFTVYDENKLIYHNGIDTDPYLRAFFSNIACRPSCYECCFKEQYHKADFTIWDCFDVEKYDKGFDDDKGTTRILINSEKGFELFNEIKDKHKVKEIDVNELVGNFYQMFNSISQNKRRTDFFKDLNNEEFDYVMKKYFSNTIKCKIEKYLRIIFIRLGIYKKILKIGKKIRKRN